MTGVYEGWSVNENLGLLSQPSEHKSLVTKGGISPTNKKEAQKLPDQSEGATKKDA